MKSRWISVSLLSWEKATTGFFHVIGLRSIKSKIIVFALLASLIPSVTMGWLSYRNNRRAVDEKIAQELPNLTSHAARELDLWFKKHRYETRVFSSSYEPRGMSASELGRLVVGLADNYTPILGADALHSTAAAATSLALLLGGARVFRFLRQRGQGSILDRAERRLGERVYGRRALAYRPVALGSEPDGTT